MRGTAGPIATLAAVLVVLAAMASAWVGWLIAGQITVAVGVAALLCAVLLVAGAWVLTRVGVVAIAVHPPRWLRQLEDATPVSLPWSDAVQRAVNLGAEEARHFRQGRIGTEHLLLGLMREDGHATRALAALGVTFEATVRAVDFLSGVGGAGGEERPALDAASRRVLDDAAVRARAARARTVGPDHLLLALANDPQGSAAAVLDHLGCTPVTLAKALRDTRR